MRVVLARVHRRDHAAWMDRRAVVLVVVLGDGLPVHGDDVSVFRSRNIRLAHGATSCSRFPTYSASGGASPIAFANTQPCHLRRAEISGKSAFSNPGTSPEPRRAPQRSVQAVDPRVVRTRSRAGSATRPARAARARWRQVLWKPRRVPERSCTSSDPSRPIRTARWSPGWRRSSARPTAQPSPLEEALGLPAEHRRRRVGLGGQRPAAGQRRLEHSLQARRIDRSGNANHRTPPSVSG